MYNDAKALVTAAIPIYNGEKTIARSIQSIVNQDYGNIELLLINDGSTDNTKALCRSFSNEFSFIRAIDLKHGGVSKARNTAIREARGQYIVFIDSDDLVQPNYISSLMNLSSDNSANSDILPVCGIELRDAESGSVIEQRTYRENKKPIPNSEFTELYTSGLLASPCNKLYRLHVIRSENIRFRTNISTGEDLLFNLDYLHKCSSFAVDNNQAYIYNVSSSGTLHTKHSQSRFSEIRIMAEALTETANYFNCKKAVHNSIALKILDEYMHSLRLFCLNNPDTSKNRRFISDVMKTKEFRFAFKALKNSRESIAYKCVLLLRNPKLLMKYFSRNK